jgi:GntR family transcriptional regulator/MocR family aminotransferase
MPPSDLSSLLATPLPPGQSRQRALHERLRGAILQGHLKAGVRLPASRVLAAELGVARNTVLFAYEQLAAEGYLLASRHGTRVAALPLASSPDAGMALPGLSSRARAALPPPDGESGAGLLPLALGVPDVSAFPIRAWRASLDRAWQQASARQLGYAPPGGEPTLREALAQYLSGVRGLAVTPAQVIITAGTQNGRDLCARLLADAGETVWVEDPGYQAARTAFELAGLRPHGIAVDDDGLAPTPADWTGAPPRLIFVTPSHQFQTGAVLSLPRRLALIEQARRHGAWILEDVLPAI